MPPHHRNQGPHANSKTPAGKRMPLENISNTVGYHDIRKYFYETLILPYFRKFSHSKITTYTVFYDSWSKNSVGKTVLLYHHFCVPTQGVQYQV